MTFILMVAFWFALLADAQRRILPLKRCRLRDFQFCYKMMQASHHNSSHKCAHGIMRGAILERVSSKALIDVMSPPMTRLRADLALM